MGMELMFAITLGNGDVILRNLGFDWSVIEKLQFTKSPITYNIFMSQVLRFHINFERKIEI